MTLLLAEIVVPDVALAANGVATVDPLNTFPDPFEASAAVTLVDHPLQLLRRCWHFNYRVCLDA